VTTAAAAGVLPEVRSDDEWIVRTRTDASGVVFGRPAGGGSLGDPPHGSSSTRLVGCSFGRLRVIGVAVRATVA